MSARSANENSPSPKADTDTADRKEPGEVSDHIPSTSPVSQEEGETSGDDSDSGSGDDQGSESPLPTEEPPPLPNEPVPGEPVEDGWEPIWDEGAQAFYFFNRFTNVSQWENPRVPESAQTGPPGVGNHDRLGRAEIAPSNRPAGGGYNPAIHGDYDPNADYAKADRPHAPDEAGDGLSSADAAEIYAATATFNRFTGKWQRADLNPDRFSDENKSRRQMSAFFDVDAAANSHDGKSLRAERANKKLTKKELKAFKEKRREKKEEKRRAWLRD